MIPRGEIADAATSQPGTSWAPAGDDAVPDEPRRRASGRRPGREPRRPPAPRAAQRQPPVRARAPRGNRAAACGTAASPGRPRRRGRCSTASRTRTSAVASAVRGPDRDRVGGRVLPEHVERLGCGHADALALPDGEWRCAAMAADPRSGRRGRGSLPARAPSPPWRARNAALPGAGEEAEVLRLALVRHGQARRARERPHLRLGQVAEREAQPRAACAGRERGQHVALVLGSA